MSIIESIIPTGPNRDGIIDVTPPLPAGAAVGLRHFQATDLEREDISTGKRQFMVTAFHPGRYDENAPRARLGDILYPRIDNALPLLARKSGLEECEKSATFDHLKRLALRAQYHLALQSRGPCPVLIYYPGGESHRLTNAALCEALGARGFIVLALDAPRDAPVVVFPDGRMVTPPAAENESYIWPRVADVRFLIDQLDELNSTFFEGLLDPGCVGMFGHSRGGYLSNICAVEESRIRAAVNMDGFLWGVWTRQGTGLSEFPLEFIERARTMTKPILRIRSDQAGEEKARLGFEEESRDFGGDFVSVALRGWKHGDFVTTPWLSGAPESFAANARQPAAPSERVELLSEMLADFFETYLTGRRHRMAFLGEAKPGIDVFYR